MNKPHIILSHGLHSGPQATKISAMARAAETLGFTTDKPDFSDLDAKNDPREIPNRIARLADAARACGKPVILAGSSMGAYASVCAAQDVDCCGLFLLVPPVAIEGYPQPLPNVGEIPTEVIHAWHDELIPYQSVVDWSQRQNIRLTLVNDSHRLSNHVEACAALFTDYLKRYFLS